MKYYTIWPIVDNWLYKSEEEVKERSDFKDGSLVVGICESEARKMMLEGLKDPQEIEGHNLMGVSESFYDPYYLVREMIKENKINVDEISTEALFWMLETANYASVVFY